jgi:hypothetical protein
VYPYFAFVEWLGPLIEVLGVLGVLVGLAVGAVNLPFALLFFLVAYGFATILTLLTMCLEEVTFRRYGGGADWLVLPGWALLENLATASSRWCGGWPAWSGTSGAAGNGGSWSARVSGLRARLSPAAGSAHETWRLT